MIILYCGISSKTSRQAVSWFNKYNIKINKKRIEHITRRDLVHILSLSEEGFSELLKKDRGSSTQIQRINAYIKVLAFDEAVDCLMENLDILRVPIIFDEKRLVIGYNSESIRTFLTKKYRRNKMLHQKL